VSSKTVYDAQHYTEQAVKTEGALYYRLFAVVEWQYLVLIMWDWAVSNSDCSGPHLGPCYEKSFPAQHEYWPPANEFQSQIHRRVRKHYHKQTSSDNDSTSYVFPIYVLDSSVFWAVRMIDRFTKQYIIQGTSVSLLSKLIVVAPVCLPSCQVKLQVNLVWWWRVTRRQLLPPPKSLPNCWPHR